MLKVLIMLFIIPLAICLGAAVMKGLWFICGMAEWTGMGPLPWGPAFFLTLVLGSAGGPKR